MTLKIQRVRRSHGRGLKSGLSVLLIIAVGVLARQTWMSWPASTPDASSPPASDSCHAINHRWYHCYIEPRIWELISRWRGYDPPQPSGRGSNPTISTAEDVATPRSRAPLSKDAKLVSKATAWEIQRASELAERDNGKHPAELAFWIRKVRARAQKHGEPSGEPPLGNAQRSAGVRLTPPPAPAPASQNAIAGAVPGQRRQVAPTVQPTPRPTPAPSPRVPRPSSKDSQLISRASALEIREASELAARDNGTHPAELAYWIMKVRGGTVRRSLV